MADAQLQRSMEKVFASTEARVVAAYKVQKCIPSTTSTFSTKKKPPKSKGKERVICLTAERRTKRRGFKGSLHVCKVSSGTMHIQKCYLLKYITRLEAFQSSVDAATPAYIELHLSNTTFTSETRKAFQVPGPLLVDIIGSIYLFCKKHEKRPPAVSGIDTALLDTWAAQQQGKDSPLEGIGAFGAALLGGQDSLDGPDRESPASLVSAKEERDLQTLLEMFAMGVGDVEQFQMRLQDELAALEAANVHAILESGPLVHKVQVRLNDSIGLIDDLDETLAIFDLKLRHMREDIAAIEARNNRLELQTRNNGKLMAALEEVLSRLDLPEDTQDLLDQTDFDDANLEDLVAGAWEVQDHMDCLADAADNPRGLERGLATMSAVAEQRTKLQALSMVFVKRACQYLSSQMAHLGDAVLANLSKLQGGVHRSMPDHHNIRHRTRLLYPLLQVVQAIQPTALPGLREAYTQTMNVVIRKELRLYASNLRKAVAAHVGSSPSEPDMGLAHKRVDLLEGLQGSKLSYSSRSDSDSPLHAHHVGTDLPSLSNAKGYSLMPHSAWQALLDTCLPFLLAESKAAVDFLLLYNVALTAPLPGSPVKHAGSNPVSPNKSKAYQRSTSSQPSSPGGGRPQLSPTRKRSTEVLAQSKATKAGNQAEDLVPEGPRVLSGMLEGIQTDFQSLVDVVGKSNQILAVPMLSLTLTWAAKMKGNQQGQPLSELLADCCQRLRAHFAQFILDRVASISKFEGKGPIGLPGGDSVKGHHLLPFLPAFTAFVTRLQELLVDVTFTSHVESPPRTASVSSTKNPKQDDGDDGSKEEEDDQGDNDDDLSIATITDEDDDDNDGDRDDLAASFGRKQGANRKAAMHEQSVSVRSQGSLQQPGGPAALGHDVVISYDIPLAQDLKDIREVVNPGYALLARAMFQTLERLAATDMKHGDRLRLESYAYFVTAISEAGQAVPVLQWHVRQAAAAKQRAMQAYVQQQLEHGKFWKLMEFSMHVEQLLREVGAEEVPFQLHYQATDLRALLQSTMHHVEKKVHSMLARVQKHMGNTSPALVAENQRMSVE
ncbi:hypothetical protein WJX77_003610 [Trebouxia sp. C0004]